MTEELKEQVAEVFDAMDDEELFNVWRRQQSAIPPIWQFIAKRN